MEKRAFVLFPLMELDNKIMHPISRRGIAKLVEAVGGEGLKDRTGSLRHPIGDMIVKFKALMRCCIRAFFVLRGNNEQR